MVKLGENSKATALASDRQRIQAFYREALGCAVIAKEDVDIVRLGDHFHLGIRYEDSALSEADHLKALWLELRTEKPEELKRRILDFGIRELEYWDKEHFYFQAPGGQVYRLAGMGEDMSRWQR